MRQGSGPPTSRWTVNWTLSLVSRGDDARAQEQRRWDVAAAPALSRRDRRSAFRVGQHRRRRRSRCGGNRRERRASGLRQPPSRTVQAVRGPPEPSRRVTWRSPSAMSTPTEPLTSSRSRPWGRFDARRSSPKGGTRSRGLRGRNSSGKVLEPRAAISRRSRQQRCPQSRGVRSGSYGHLAFERESNAPAVEHPHRRRRLVLDLSADGQLDLVGLSARGARCA